MIAAFVLLIFVIIACQCKEYCPLCQKRNLCNLTKFMAAMLVVNGHLFLFHLDNPLLAKELNLGSECVSLFLFFSAYGLIHSYRQKGKAYLDGFIRKRVVKVILPLVTAYMIALPTYYFCVGEFSISEVISTLYWGGPFLKFSWYVTEIAVLYLLFYLVFNFSLSTKAFILSACTVLLMMILIVMDQPLWYVKSLPAFILGMYYCIYEKQVFDYVQRNKMIIIPFLLLSFFLMFRFDLLSENIEFLSKWRYTYASYYLVDLLFVFLVVFILSRLPENPKSYGMFNCYYEIYLIQNIVMMAMGKCGLNSYIYIISCLMITPVMAYYVYKINGKILKMTK